MGAGGITLRCSVSQLLRLAGLCCQCTLDVVDCRWTGARFKRLPVLDGRIWISVRFCCSDYNCPCCILCDRRCTNRGPGFPGCKVRRLWIACIASLPLRPRKQLGLLAGILGHKSPADTRQAAPFHGFIA
ncbi:hypothetical protein DFH06DRAFT_75982 [Mycena polygramma]|nr:hypothetical protein DFH06DRAFT_75982 [Mycena polygramma]